MDIIETIKKRRSIRKFTEQAIPESSITAMKTALKFAPSAGNKQSRFFHFITSKDMKLKICEAANNQKYIVEAPLVVVGSANLRNAESYKERGKTLYAIMDVAASTQNLMLTACSLGLGTCWVGAFDESKVSKALNLPDHLRPIVIIPVGTPLFEPKPPTHLNDEALFAFIQ